MSKRNSLLVALVIVVPIALSIAVSSCGESSSTKEGPSGDIKIDGSSTVYPLTQAAAELFKAENPNVKFSIGLSGTGGGFEKFCAGETVISDASRPIEPDEAATCQKAGIKYAEVQVANDGISVVANKENDFVDCLTVDQLKKIWDKGSAVKSWNQVDPKYPDKPIKLYGPGTDSGTFDYFTESINGEEGQSRSDYTASEDDNVLVQGVSGDEGALGYFGFSYFEQNQDKLKLIGIDDGGGCVKPSAETIQDGSYKPLSRPLFIYPSQKALEQNKAVKPFLDFYVSNSSEAASRAGLVPMTSDQQQKADAELKKLG